MERAIVGREGSWANLEEVDEEEKRVRRRRKSKEGSPARKR